MKDIIIIKAGSLKGAVLFVARLFCLTLFSFLAGTLVAILGGFPAHVLLTILGMFVGTIVVAALTRWMRFLFGAESNRFYGWLSIVMFTGIVLFYSIEKWRGKRMWAQAQREMAAKGETMGEIVPPEVPEAEDMAKAPILVPLSEYRGPTPKPGYDRLAAIRLPRFPQSGSSWEEVPWIYQRHTDEQRILKVLRQHKSKNAPRPLPETFQAAIPACLEPFAAELEEVRQASLRPHANFKTKDDGGYEMIMGNLGKVFSFRAEAELKSGKPAEALDDIRCALRLARHQYPASISVSSEMMFTTIASLQPVWEGLASHRWNEEQLDILQKELEETSPLTAYDTWVRTLTRWHLTILNRIYPINAAPDPEWFGEKAPAPLKFIRMVYPTGWAYQDRADLYTRSSQLAKMVDIRRHLAFPELSEQPPRSKTTDPFYNVVIKRGVDNRFKAAAFWTALAQTSVNLASMACALEHYRLAEGKHPENLQALTPRYIEKIPSDLFDGQPLRYRVEPNGSFVLHSIGWNLTDDHGVAATGDDLFEALHRGDWVWRY